MNMEILEYLFSGSVA